MFDYEFDNFIETASPPTREAIDNIRQKQLDALKAMQEQLLDVISTRNKSAA